MGVASAESTRATCNAYRGVESRAELIEKYAHLVKYVAGRLSLSLPSHVTLDDLYSEGVLGLIDAIEKYDPSRGVKFETYAIARIKGAILDGLRRMDWIPVHMRQKVRSLEKAYAHLEGKLGRTPTDKEVAEYLGMDEKAFGELLQNASAACLVSLEENWFESFEWGTSPIETMADPNAPDPLARLELEDEKRELAEAIDSLPERERLVIVLYYYEGLTLREIAEVLQVSIPRVSQLHARAILALKAKLKKNWA